MSKSKEILTTEKELFLPKVIKLSPLNNENWRALKQVLKKQIIEEKIILKEMGKKKSNF